MSLRALLFVALSWNVSAQRPGGNHGDNHQSLLLSSSFGVPGLNATFDYIIVGGGTAGLTVAARLAEDTSITVAVVEAGGFYENDNGNISVVPGTATQYAGADPDNVQPLVDWGFVTTPQPGAANRTIHYARGKTLGGSSARNYMLYQRHVEHTLFTPTIGTMQLWADQVGDQSYTFENVLPFFEKSTTLTLPNPLLYHNMTMNQTNANFREKGPLQVSYQNYISPFATWTQPALELIGLKQIDGFNSGELIGSGFVTWTVDATNATRSSSETSFLQQALRTSTTLSVYTQSFAEKILFDSNKTATGVIVTTQGTFGTPGVTYTLSARKEVILSTGAFQSPQLLMVSGIGPQEILEANDIPIVKILPGVGQDMWDHVFFAVDYEVNMPTISAPLNFPEIFFADNAAYVENATGPFSVFGGCYFGWEKLPPSQRAALSPSTLEALEFFPPDWPEIEFLPSNAYLGYNLNYATEDPLDGKNYASMAGAMVATLSRGNITLSSSSAMDPPIINSNWLTHPADKEVAIAMFKRLRDAWSALASLNVTVGEEALPGPQVQSDEDILEFIGESMIQLFHPTSTCKMGKIDDEMAVVDTVGRVYGVRSLRIVDASIFPICPPGHPQATVYMLAEKIADAILNG